MKKAAPSPCPCGGGPYAECCGRLHRGVPPADAEALMRSRYSAYVLKLESYLRATWHPSTRPPRIDFDDGVGAIKWLGLQVERHERTAADASVVEFIARCKVGGRARRMHEVSRFVLENGQWYYVDGKESAAE